MKLSWWCFHRLHLTLIAELKPLMNLKNLFWCPQGSICHHMPYIWKLGGGAHLTSSILLHSSAKFLYSSKTSVHLTCQKRFAKNTIYSTTQIQWTRQKTLLWLHPLFSLKNFPYTEKLIVSARYYSRKKYHFEHGLLLKTSPEWGLVHLIR